MGFNHGSEHRLFDLGHNLIFSKSSFFLCRTWNKLVYTEHILILNSGISTVIIYYAFMLCSFIFSFSLACYCEMNEYTVAIMWKNF